MTAAHRPKVIVICHRKVGEVLPHEESPGALADLLSRDRVPRVNKDVPEGWFNQNIVDQIEEVIALARSLAVEMAVLRELQSHFLNCVHAPAFQAAHPLDLIDGTTAKATTPRTS